MKAKYEKGERETEIKNLQNYLIKRIKSLGWKEVFFTVVRAKNIECPDTKYHDLNINNSKPRH